MNRIAYNNYHSYYGKKGVAFSDHLNFILGSNGDGKTTFFETYT